MAQISNSFATFNSTRIREQLMNKIFNVSVDETPLLALIGKDKADGPFIEWLTDSFRAGAANKVEQGNQSVATARTPTVRLSNRTQISEDVFAITGTNQASEKAGGNDEVGYQKMKSMLEVKKDIEFGIFNNTTAIAASSGVAPQARGLPGFADSNLSMGVSGVAPNPVSNVAPTDGTLRAFAEQQLKDVMKLMFDNGAPMDDSLYAFIPSAQRSAFDAMLAGTTRFDKSEDKSLTATLEVYIGPFGRVKAVNARHMRAREIFILNKEWVKLMQFRSMSTKPLAKRGDAEEYLTNVEWSLRVNNTRAIGAIKDLS